MAMDYAYKSYKPMRAPTRRWPSWHNHTGAYPRFSFCPTPGLSVARYAAELDAMPDVWECFAITDHAFSIAIPDLDKAWPWAWYEDESILLKHRADGSTTARMAAYADVCAGLQREKGLYAGIEIEVNAHGHMALPEEFIRGFDIVVGSIHHNPGDPAQWIERHFTQLARVLELPCNIVGHPLRHLRSHSTPEKPLPDEVVEETLEMAKAAGVAIEINAHYPQIQDDVPLLRGACERGVEVAFSMDLHYPEEFGNWRYFEDVVELAGVGDKDMKLFAPGSAKGAKGDGRATA